MHKFGGEAYLTYKNILYSIFLNMDSLDHFQRWLVLHVLDNVRIVIRWYSIVKQ